MKEEILNNLQSFLEKDKFSDIEWGNRGLNPSPEDICQLMAAGINNCCIDLIELKKVNATQKELKKTIKKGLKSIDKRAFDTEEKEFIGDSFYDLASIVSIDINNELNSWIYGSFLTFLIRITKMFQRKTDSK